ncbi:ComF family protein [Chamaesiphon sp. VAR_48_metabat_135_sub]|uniref:ComF family protein n=1 Tax=Chamaesiphon sp. VAR_48_metabat_135_sub TaxID=2964699 RepID=UPI00286C6DC8|nr:ComF family protein [Chamaesiphon sp. VAR_48_metabat_135_sub]
MFNSLQPLLNRALNLFLKPNCPLCNRTAEHIFCRYCQRQIQDCQLARPDRYWQGDLPLFAWGKYQGSIKQSIAKFKYDGHRSISNVYGEWLAESWQKFTPPIPTKLTVIPIPLHAEKMASRGFNQAELIARSFCQVTGAKLDLSLQRTRSTIAQFKLSKSARQENVAGAFTLINSHLQPDSTVLLIDDIYTTGATVRSVASVLRSHQVNVCGVAVIATG